MEFNVKKKTPMLISKVPRTLCVSKDNKILRGCGDD